jgi:ABC-type transporter Mla subunit MlaD
VETVSGTISANHQEIDEIIKNLAVASEQIAEITVKLNGSLNEVERATGAYGDLAVEARELVADVRPAMQQLSDSSVPEVDRLLRDTRRMVTSVNRLVTELERNPTEFLLGDEPAEYGN